MIIKIAEPPNLTTRLQVIWKKSDILSDTRTQSAKSIVWGRGITQFPQQINGIKKRVIYYRLKQIKDMYQTNALGGTYLDLIQRFNCKKPFFEKNQGKGFSMR